LSFVTHVSHGVTDTSRMTRRAQLEAAERDFRRFLADTRVLPEPDRVEYGADEVRFFWDDRHLVVAVEAKQKP
jgi:hypothetical protein